MRLSKRIIVYPLLVLFLGSFASPLVIHDALAAQPESTLLYPADNTYIDSGNPNTNFGGISILAAESYCESFIICLQSRYMESWLQFNIAGIPPGATITGAILTLTLSYTNGSQTIGVYSESSNSWTQGSITWNNAPRSSVSSSPLAQDFVTSSTTLYSWNVQAAVSGALGNQYLTLVLQPTSSQGNNDEGWSIFDSSAAGGSVSPSLTITYSYASSSVSVSSNSAQYGSTVSVLASTNPSESTGTMTLQYSADQVNWITLSSTAGGSLGYGWLPPNVGTYYFRAAWTISWGLGSYTTTSNVQTVQITQGFSSTQLALPKASATIGQSVILTETVSPQASDGVASIQYSADQTNWISLSTGAPSSGTLSTSWTPSNVGKYYVRATWSGDVDYQGSTSPVQTLQVTLIPSSIQLTLSQTGIILGQSVTLMSLVSPQASDGTTAIQYSTDQVNWIPLSTGTPSGGALSVDWTPPNVGTYYVMATWSGDADHQASTSPTQTLIVTQVQTILTLNPLDTANLNQTITITAMLSDVASNPISGASVTFAIGSTAIGTGTTDSSGLASVTYELDQSAGQYSIEASYAGSEANIPSSAQTALIIRPWLLTVTSSVSGVSLINFNGRNYTTDSTGTVTITVNSTGNYQIRANSPLTITPGVREVFISWGGAGMSLSVQINVDSDVNLAISTKTQYYLAVQSPYGRVTGNGWYDADSKASFTSESIVDQGNGTRRVFAGWSEGGNLLTASGNSSFPMTSPQSLTATWTKQFDFIVISPYGNPSGQGWYEPGTSVTASVQSPFQTGSATRYVTTSYSGEGSTPNSGTGTNASFQLSAPSTIDFQWQPQYLIQTVTMYGSVSGTGWYDSGSVETFSIPNPIISISNGTRAAFLDWNGNGTSDSVNYGFSVNGPLNVTATWNLQYYLTVTTQYSSSDGQGWYDAGSQATISINQTSVPENLFISRAFDGWTGGTNVSTQNAAVTMTRPEQVVAVWSNDYENLYLAIGGGAAAAIAIAVVAVFLTFRPQKLDKV